MNDSVLDFLDNLLQKGCKGTHEATREVYRFFPWISRMEAEKRVKAWERQYLRKKLTAKGAINSSTPPQDASRNEGF